MRATADELIPLTRRLLEVPLEIVETALGHELEGGSAIADDLEGRRCVFLAGLYGAEREIAETLKALAIGRPPWRAIDADKGSLGSSSGQSSRLPTANDWLFASLSFPRCW